MLTLLHSEGAWSCYIANDNAALELPAPTQLLEQINAFTHVLKDDRRSLVKRGHLAGMDVIAKQPRDKNRRRWAQFLSLFRSAEAKKTFESLLRFKQLEIESVEPVCVLEKRRRGQVVDSWIIYQFRLGNPCQPSDLPDVVATLKKLHRHGFRHEDPNLGNFLRDSAGTLFLIDCKGKSKGGEFAAQYDFLLLSLRNDGVTKEQVDRLVGEQGWSMGKQFAKIYGAYIAGRTALKQALRRRKSKQDVD